jgi:hypothetical protein
VFRRNKLPTGAALGEDTERKAGGLERDGAPVRPEGGQRAKLLGARIACVVGVFFGVGSVLAALIGGATNVSGGALGAALGILGYFLGARRLATATVVLCVSAIFFALAASQGLIPGIESFDRTLPNVRHGVDD